MPGKIDKAPWGDYGHDQDITCLAVFKDHIYTGGADGQIKIWTQDLVVKKTIEIHDVYINCLCLNSKGKLYSSSCDGVLKCLENPLKSDAAKQMEKVHDPIQAMYCDGEVLYTGNNLGQVVKWVNDKQVHQFGIEEEVKSLVAENNIVYTARNTDTVITEVCGKTNNFITRADIPGRAPVCLFGPTVNGHKSYLAFTTRDGKGITLVDNLPEGNFKVLWTKEKCHDMVINSLCGDENSLYSGAYDGKVKRWINLNKEPKNDGEVDLKICVTVVAPGHLPNTCYTGSSDGIVRRLKWSDD